MPPFLPSTRLITPLLPSLCIVSAAAWLCKIGPGRSKR